MKKAKLWAHATYEMVEHGDFSKRLNLPAYVRAENYDFIYQRCENMEAENARLKAEVDRLKLDYYENKTGEVSATVVQTFNTETGEADYVVSLDDYKKMADMFNAEFLRLKAEVERLDTLCKQLMAQHSDISCENIMLRKAGDAMAGSHITLIQVYLKDSSDEWHQELHNRWNAAKEGKPQP
jgi:PHD/YefM family antitoxin component YafN of YafNO toxin-antitoxin module